MLAFLPPLGHAPRPSDPEPDVERATAAGIVLAVVLIITGTMLPYAFRSHALGPTILDLSAMGP